jgi:proteasome accessory factor C
MHKAVLSADRVLLLLSLVPYLKEHGPTTVTELAEAFDVAPSLLRRLVTFLGTAGVPGETLTYQDEDLFDIDWDALYDEDLVSLTNVVVVDDAPRFAPAETAALIAGLHALTGVLPGETAELARETAEKLGAALGQTGRSAPLSVTADPADLRLSTVISAIEEVRELAFDYRDAAGQHSTRTVDPIAVTQEGNAWYLRAHCHDREAERTFRLDHMTQLRAGAVASHRLPVDSSRAATSDRVPHQGETFTLTAELPLALLPQIQGFQPEVVESLPDDRVLVTVEAWHDRAAIQLVQLAPGQIIVRSPSVARTAVRDWAARALAAYDA